MAIYARVSTQDQTVENQLIPLKQYAERMDWDYEVFIEKDSTRKTRPVQYDLYNRLLKKEFDGLLIYKFDRWARSTTELIQHITNLVEKNIKIISIKIKRLKVKKIKAQKLKKKKQNQALML